MRVIVKIELENKIFFKRISDRKDQRRIKERQRIISLNGRKDPVNLL
jgi:hypothetical protein